MNTILVVEDNEMMRENTTEILELSRYHVLSAENCCMGIELAEKNHPDLIICDVRMKEIDGVCSFEKLNNTAKEKKIPVIILTPGKEKPEIASPTSGTPDVTLNKPYLGEELLKMVALFLPALL